MSSSIVKLYNTASKQIEVFTPIHNDYVSMYACGPTVYSYAHIGNMRTYVFEDVLRRTLEHAGYQVKHVMNVTDVGHLQSDADAGDDKMMIAAQREQRSPWQIARFYEDEFFRHAELLNIKRPETVCRATEHIKDMISMVEMLVQKGYAYVSEGNVYFEVAKFDRYAEFAGLQLDAHLATERVDYDTRKRSQADFVLWFSQSKYPHQIMKWDSPWGVGFPGWHIECSAMATKYLGDHIDIHCGGIDHVRVHHTNEIAQSECCSDHKWVNYWLHGEFLNVDDGKMSKSKGDTLTVDTLIKEGFTAMDYRYLLLTAHYRSTISFSYEALTQASNTLANLRQKIQQWKKEAVTWDGHELSARARFLQQEFWEAAYDDLHTPRALAVAWNIAKDTQLPAAEKLSLFADFDHILGLDLLKCDDTGIILTEEQHRLLDARQQARLAKNWAEADRIRDLLLQQGIQVKDTADGVEVAAL